MDRPDDKLHDDELHDDESHDEANASPATQINAASDAALEVTSELRATDLDSLPAEAATALVAPRRGYRWRQGLAIIHKEFSIALGGQRFMVLQTMFVAYLATVLLLNIETSESWQLRLSGFIESGPRLVGTLSVYAFCALLFLAPTLTIDVLSQERSSGMLEIVRCAPLSARRLFMALIGSRLLLVIQFVNTVIPLFALPMLYGGLPAMQIMASALLSMLVGTAAATLYAVGQSAFQLGTLALYRRLGAFLLVPLSIFGLPALVLAVPAIIVAAAVPSGPEILSSIVFPYVSLGAICGGRSILAPSSISALLTLMVLLIVVYRQTSRSLDRWLTFEPKQLGRRHAPRDSSNPFSSRVSKLTRVFEKGAKPEGVGLTASGRKRAPLLSMQRIHNLKGVSRWIYEKTRRNPIFARFLLESDTRSGRALATGSLIISSTFMLLFSAHLLNGRHVAQEHFGLRGFLFAIVAVIPVLLMGTRLIPVRQKDQFSDVAYTTPLNARKIFVGFLSAALVLTYPYMIGVGLLAVVNCVRSEPWVVIGTLVMFPLHILFCIAIVLWVSAWVRGFGLRLGACALLLSLPLLPVLATLWGGRLGWVAYHPTFQWIVGSNVERLWSSVLTLSVATLLLLLGYLPVFNALRQRT